MKIELRKFGTTLTSRQDGREAFAAIQPTVAGLGPNETIELDFAGVNTFSPSWADEFITAFFKVYGDRMLLAASDNPSVKATISMLEKINKVHFNRS